MAIYVRTELPIAPYQQPTKHGTDDGGGGLWLNVFFSFLFRVSDYSTAYSAASQLI